MYERFYRLRERPFALTPDPDYLYPSRVHKEAFELSALRHREPRRFRRHHRRDRFRQDDIAADDAARSGQPDDGRACDEHTARSARAARVGDDRRRAGVRTANRSRRCSRRSASSWSNERASGRLVLLVIDEAQNLSLPALEEIRMLSNLETEKSKLLQIILIGQPDLARQARPAELEQLRQRITVSYHLEPLDADETTHYMNHRLARASIGAPLEFPRRRHRPHSRAQQGRAAADQRDRRRRRSCSATARSGAKSTRRWSRR